MSYEFLQQYWWLVVSLLGALLVFLLFVQGANSMVHSIGHTEEGQRKVLASTGLKWEITFTTLVTSAVPSSPLSPCSIAPASAVPIGCG